MINYGTHHGYSLLTSENSDDYKAYKMLYQKLIDYCIQKCECVSLVTGSQFNIDDVSVSQIRKEEVISRNSIVRELCKENGCILFDLYNLAKESRAINFRYIDGVHFESYVYSFVSNRMMKDIFMKVFPNEGKIAKAETSSNIMKELCNEQQVMLYGKGNVGITFYYLMDYFIPNIKIIAWIVTEKDDSEQVFLDIPVIQAKDVINKDCLLIIASKKYSMAMAETAQKCGIKNVRRIEKFKL